MQQERKKVLHLQMERNLGTTPNPLNWYVQRIFLDTYSANLFQKSNYYNIRLFYYTIQAFLCDILAIVLSHLVINILINRFL